MNYLLHCWHVDASPGGSEAKCGEKIASVGIVGVAIVTDTIVLNSFPYLVGRTVSVMIGGLDCGDLVVAANGSVTIPYGSDPEGLLTVAYLTSISDIGGYGDLETRIKIVHEDLTVTNVYVPVVVGYAYTSRGQLLRPVSQEDLKTPKGPGTGKLRRVFKFSVFLWNAAKVKFGTDFDHLQEQKLTYGDRSTKLPSNVPFTGIHEATVDDKNSFDGQLAWEVTRPFPLGVVSSTAFTNSEDR